MDNDINNINDQNKPRGRGKEIAGALLLVIGAILLLKELDVLLVPSWIWDWPTWVIVWGLYSGARHNFRNPAWFILIFVGVAFMLNDALPHMRVGDFIWPIAIIGVGLWIILKRNHTFDKKTWKKDWEHKWDWRNPVTPNPTDPNADPGTSTNVPPNGPQSFYGDDHLDAVSVFGGVKKTILSKDFKGGDIVNIFGGAELDFTQADINGRVIIDITQIFGGTKIVVPSNWQVVSDIAAVFASVDDKRLRSTASPNSDKILVLKGVSIFAGVDIRSY